MKSKKHYILRFVLLASLFLPACGQADNNQEEVAALAAQVHALETQNALLQQPKDTNTQNPANQAAPQVPPPPAQAQSQLPPTSAPIEETLPSSPVPAGEPVSYDGWVMTVDPSIKIDTDSSFMVTILVRNTSPNSRIFRYQNASIQVSDDKGNKYDPAKECFEAMKIVKNFEIETGEVGEIFSNRYTIWCDSNNTLPPYIGPIAQNADRLILTFDNFGPFTDIQVFIDL